MGTLRVSARDDGGAFTFNGNQLYVGSVAADNDGGIGLAFEIGHKIFNLHGTDEEVFYHAASIILSRDDSSAQLFGKVADFNGPHEGVTLNNTVNRNVISF